VAVALAETVRSLNGVRTVYETVAAHLVDGRVHPMVNLRQATGRWSVTAPGLTVMGKRGGRHVEREVFLAEPGHVIIAADLSQVDARAIAALSQDSHYLALFDPGKDAHVEIAAMVWGDRSRREDAKVIGHGWNYGMGLDGLVRNAGVPYDTAFQFDQAMREQFPELVRWRTEVRQRARAGELLDNGFGRMMRPDPERAHTQGPALMGQGCARDLMMEGLLRLDRSTWPYLRAVVHDEVVLSVPEDIVDDVEHEVVRALGFEWRNVAVVAGLVGRGKSWGSIYAKKGAQ
jgi:DNA polymerase-1